MHAANQFGLAALLLLALCVSGEGSEGAEGDKVLVYTVGKCTYCAEVKAFLKENGIDYEEKQLSDKKVWAEMQKKAMKNSKAEAKKAGDPAKALVLAPQVFLTPGGFS
jgi:glutaredoxin